MLKAIEADDDMTSVIAYIQLAPEKKLNCQHQIGHAEEPLHGCTIRCRCVEFRGYQERHVFPPSPPSIMQINTLYKRYSPTTEYLFWFYVLQIKVT